MSHAYIFFLSVLFLKYTVDWHEKPSYKNSLLLGIFSGLMILVRPLTILFLIVFVFYNVTNIATFKHKIKFVLDKRWQLGLIILLIFLFFLPQMIYWKSITGNWLFNSYQNERFFFNHPHLTDALFGFRKGWLLYTPVMVLALLGFFFLKKRASGFSFSLPLFVTVNIYFLSCWWAWWFGGSFGNRGYIDMYALLSIPFASCLAGLSERKWKRITVIAFAFLLMGFGVFETLQYRYGALHHDGMTKEAYRISFLKLRPAKGFYEALRKPDYENAKAGLPERELIYD
jgi:hypothetical protein